MPTDRIKLKELLDELAVKQKQYELLAFDEESEHIRGAPASDAQIASLERRLGKPLPDSYRAFLQLHNGWSNFDGDGKLLSVEDHGSAWVKEKIEYWNELWEPDQNNPFTSGALPVMLGDDIENFLVLDPKRMVFDEYDSMAKEETYKDFIDYLADQLELTESMIEDETIGSDDGEED